MNGKGIVGSVGGIPVNGAIVSINDADAAMMMNAVSGLVKTAAVVGVGIGLLSLIFGNRSGSASNTLQCVLSNPKKKEKNEGINPVPMTSLVEIKSDWRHTFGVCISDVLRMRCDEDLLEIPIGMIHKIGKYSYVDIPTFLYVWTIDGAFYKGKSSEERQLAFMTAVGIQTIYMPKKPEYNEETLITPVTVADAEELRSRLLFALSHTGSDIIDAVGRDVFEKYFVLH